MDLQELEDWFSQEKERLEKQAFKSFMNSSDWTKPKKHFDKEYKKLIREYQKQQAVIYRNEKINTAVHKPIKKYHDWKTNQIIKIKQWKERKILAIKKWAFDRKIKKILEEERTLY